MYDSFWNYFKKSFKLIFQKPILFVPTLISLALSIVFTLGIIASIGVPDSIVSLNIGMISLILLGVLIMIVLELFISAGNFNMIKQAVDINEVSMDDFWVGAKKYTGRIFLGGLIFSGILLLVLLIIVVPVILTKSSGLTITLLILFSIPVIIFILFISLWETILVYEDCNIIKSFKLSFSFVKKHFGLVFVINLLQAIFTNDKNSHKNGDNGASINLPFHSKHGGKTYNLHVFGKYIPFSIGTIGVISILITIIKAFLSLYFEVIFFVIYHDRRKSIFNDGNGFNDLEAD
ncbi:MAG: hypothetical protein N4A68_08800 [Maledivibacter sp.]|jgi:hypothetical protein|nr:hypothetical protein [Maledivibacter sp.]